MKQFNAEWFHNHAYIPNILAAITGFLIGAPVAVVVLATFTIQREEKSAADRVNAITQIAWNQFREALSDLCDEQRIKAMESGAKRIQDIHNQTWHGLNHSGNRPDEEFKKDISFVKAQASAWSEATADTLASVGNTTDLRLRWLAILRDWNTLDQYIRLQRLERGLPWFDRQIDSVLQGYLTIDEHPLRSFFAMHEGPSWSPDMPRDVYTNNMYGAQAVVESLQHLGSSQDTFDKMRTRNPERFPTTRVNGYPQEVEKSTKRMSELRYYVEEIEKSGWPTASD